MKKTKILYWVFTILFAAFMIFTAIPNVMLTEESAKFMNDLGFPDYFTIFIGITKILGSIAILIPNLKTIKEWAYAGLFFDLIGAIFSVICKYDLNIQISFMLLPLTLGILSYYYFRKTHYSVS